MPASIGQALPLSLFPSTCWWAAALSAGGNCGLVTGSLSKGTAAYSRYKIATANGDQQLSVPLKGGRKQRLPLRALHIDYTHDWQRQHWGALYSAYGRAPYFEHYAAALEAIIYKRYERLEDLNRAAIAWLAQEMRLSISFSEEEGSAGWQEAQPKLAAYHQVFEACHGFIPGLSAIDLLMNEGPYAGDFLKIL